MSDLFIYSQTYMKLGIHTYKMFDDFSPLYSEANLESKWFKIAYMQCGPSPCGSWRFPGDSRQHTGTSNPPGHESPLPADVTRWSSLHGSSALQIKGLSAPISFHYMAGLMRRGDEDTQRQADEWILNLMRLSAVNRSAICQEEIGERLLVKAYKFQVWTAV